MEQSPEEPETKSLNLGSPDGWTQVLNETSVLGEEANLVLISVPSFTLPVVVAAAYLALRHAVRSDSNEPYFIEQMLVVPPGLAADRFREEIIQSIQGHMKAAGADELSTLLVPLTCETRTMVTLSEAPLVQELQAMEPQSGCILIHPELYRSAYTNDSGPFGTSTLPITESCRHLESLLEKLAAVSRDTKLLIVLFAEASRVDINAITPPEDSNYLAISSGERSDDALEIIVTPLLDAFRQGGWTAVKACPQFDPDNAHEIAFALAGVFGSERNLPQAWTVMEPFVDRATEWTVGSQIGMAAAALSAGDMEASYRLLSAAINEDIQNPEELSFSLEVAYSLGNGEMFQTIFERIESLLPNSRHSRRGKFLQLFQKRDFENALKVAQELKLPVEMAQCQAFLSDDIDAEEFLDQMGKGGELEQGLISCADEALFRSQPLRAIHWASQIAEGHRLFERAFQIRVKALRLGLQSDDSSHFLQELESVMRVVAKKPTAIHLRGQLERLLENQLEEPFVKVVLLSLLTVAIGNQALRDDMSIEASKSLSESRDMNKGVQNNDQFGDFIEKAGEFFVSYPGASFGIADGRLPETLTPMVGPRLIFWLAESALEAVGQGIALEESRIFIRLVCLCCKEVAEPIIDQTLVHCFVERQASLGAAQDSRDLAETALQFLPELQPSHLDWRTSQGWATMAEACLRSGDALSALRYLCLAFLAHEAPAISVDLLRRRYRMAARIFRDLYLPTDALRCITLERQLLTKAGAPEEQAVPLEIFEMQVQLMSLSGVNEEDLLRILSRTQELLATGASSELYPLTAIQANLLRLLSPERCPSDILKDFRQRVDSFPPQIGGMLRMTACLNPTRDDVAELFSNLPDAPDHESLAYQIRSALPALVNAIRHAVASGDRELFLLASGAFAQPSLGVLSSKSHGEVAASGQPTFLRTTTLEGLRTGTFEHIPRYSFRPLMGITMDLLQSHIVSDEGVLVMAGEPVSQLCGMLVTSSEVAEPHPITGWSEESFRQWRIRFKDDLFWAKPNPFVPGIDRLDPPTREIREIFAGLSPGLIEVPEQLTIIPPSRLFGFTWQLSLHNTGFLIENCSVAIAPSVQWLVEARTSSWDGKCERHAWIGARESTDPTLIALRSMVEGDLQSHGFVISEESGPSGFEGSEIAVVGAHGGTGFGDYFRSVGDRVNHFSPSEISNMLKGCGCVVLAVCSGGRSDGQHGSEETLGLVTSLFRVGVRCVFAPPWPLDIEVVQYWLPAFLAGMDSGHSAGASSTMARDAVRLELDHPCAWGQMHLYGDQDFRLPSRTNSPETGESLPE